MLYGMSSYDFGAAIRAEKARQRFTTGELAEKVGMSVHQVRRRMSGSAPITTDELASFATAFGIPLPVLAERAAA